MEFECIKSVEIEYGKKIYSVLQLRLHDSMIRLKDRIIDQFPKEKYEVDLTYITSGGMWHDYSWKGNIKKSGCIATNIGIHFF